MQRSAMPQMEPTTADTAAEPATKSVGTTAGQGKAKFLKGQAITPTPKAADSGAARRMTRRFSLIPMPAIKPGIAQYRKKFDAEALESLAASIKEKGLTQPLLVRESRRKDNFELVAGYRRWQAAHKLGLAQVPAVILDGLETHEVAEIALMENLQREDLSPLEEADAFRLLVDKYNRSHEQIAEVCGKSRSYVTNTIRLLALPAKVKSLLENGDLNYGQARALLGSEDPVALAEKVVAKSMTVRAVEKIVSRDNKKSAAAADAADAETTSPDRSASGQEDDALTPEMAAVAESLGALLDLKVSFDVTGPKPGLKLTAGNAHEIMQAALRIQRALQLDSLTSALDRTSRQDGLV